MLTPIKRFDIGCGTDIKAAVMEMIDIARQDDVVVEAEFNGVELKAYSTSDAVNVINEYYVGLSRKSDNKKIKDRSAVSFVPHLTGINGCDETSYAIELKNVKIYGETIDGKKYGLIICPIR